MTVKPCTPSPRRVRFEYPPDMAPVWTPSRPEFSCAANSVSLMMPTIEPFFVRSARAALGDLGQPLAAQAEDYVFQEAQHHRQHVIFNRMLTDNYPSLSRLERVVNRVYRSVESRGSLRFNLGFAAASETMAYSAARWAAQRRTELFTGAHDVAATMFLWHLAEEVEHKSVAHDIYWDLYRHRSGARRTYGAALLSTLLLSVLFVVVGTVLMLASERRLFHPVAWLRLIGWAITFGFELISNLVMSLMPGHHPTDFTDPLWYEVWLREFDADTGSVPVWYESNGSAP